MALNGMGPMNPDGTKCKSHWNGYIPKSERIKKPAVKEESKYENTQKDTNN
jgi:hypothetical protein